MIFDGDREYIGPYLRYLANEVGLRDWFLYHSHGTPQDIGHSAEAAACCVPHKRRKRATIAFADNWMDHDEDEFLTICVHELLHCHFEAIREPLRRVAPVLGSAAFDPVWEATTEALEFCLDSIAYELAKHLPMPSEWLELETEPEG